jgi:hypothetical protein
MLIAFTHGLYLYLYLTAPRSYRIVLGSNKIEDEYWSRDILYIIASPKAQERRFTKRALDKIL